MMHRRYRYHAFISYSSADRDLVVGARDLLSEYQLFVDQADIQPNASWRQVLRQAITASQLVFVFWSADASQSSWVQEERRWAEQQGKELVYIVSPDSPRTPSNDRQSLTVPQPDDIESWAEQLRVHLQKQSAPEPQWRELFVLADLADDQAPVFDLLQDLDRLDLSDLAEDRRAAIVVVTDQVAERLRIRPGEVGHLVANSDGVPRLVFIVHDSVRRSLPLGLRLRRAEVLPTREAADAQEVLENLVLGSVGSDNQSNLGVPLAITDGSSPYRIDGPGTVHLPRSGGGRSPSIPYRQEDGSLIGTLRVGNETKLLDQHPVTVEQWCAFLNLSEQLGIAETVDVNGLQVCTHTGSGFWLGVDAASYYERRRQSDASPWERHGPTRHAEQGWISLIDGDQLTPATMVTWWGAAAYAGWVDGQPLSDNESIFNGQLLPTVEDLQSAGEDQVDYLAASATGGQISSELEWIRRFADGTLPTITGPAPAQDYFTGQEDRRFYSVRGNIAEWCEAGERRGPGRRLSLVPVFGGSYRSPEEHCRLQRGAALVSPWSFAPDRGFRCQPGIAR